MILLRRLARPNTWSSQITLKLRPVVIYVLHPLVWLIGYMLLSHDDVHPVACSGVYAKGTKGLGR